MGRLFLGVKEHWGSGAGGRVRGGDRASQGRKVPEEARTQQVAGGVTRKDFVFQAKKLVPWPVKILFTQIASVD